MAKRAYIGAPTEVPVYTMEDFTEVVTSANLGSWFTFSDPDGISTWSGTTLTVVGTYSNERVKLTALVDMTVSFDYEMDSFCKISFNGSYICDSGDSGSYTGTLRAGKSFYIYNSSAVSEQTSKFANITCTKQVPVESGTEVKPVARRIKRAYIGVDGVARRIKVAYIGIGGVARPCYGDGLYKYGEITSLSGPKCRLAATTLGDYALFGGGEDRITFGGSSLTYCATVDAYLKGSLTKSTPTALSVARSRLAATTVGNYALFAGGCSSTGTTVRDERYDYTQHTTVDAYQKESLTRSAPSVLSSGRYALAATTIGDYALFAGGTASGIGGVSTVDAYQKESLTRSKPSVLHPERCELAATTIGDYALFAGGADGMGDVVGLTNVDAYQKGSLTRSIPTALSVARTRVVAFSIGDYAVFVGGESYNSSTGKSDGYSTVDVYHKDSLTRSTPEILTSKGSRTAATVLGDYALLGPFSSSSTTSTNIEVIDKSLTYVQFYNKAASLKGAATTIGDYALFAGGISGGESQDTTMVIALY